LEDMGVFYMQMEASESDSAANISGLSTGAKAILAGFTGAELCRVEGHGEPLSQETCTAWCGPRWKSGLAPRRTASSLSADLNR